MPGQFSVSPPKPGTNEEAIFRRHGDWSRLRDIPSIPFSPHRLIFPGDRQFAIQSPCAAIIPPVATCHPFGLFTMMWEMRRCRKGGGTEIFNSQIDYRV